MPAIDRAIGGRIDYNQTELKYVLQQLHRHRRDTRKISQDTRKAKADRKRKGVNSRRSEVSNFRCNNSYIGLPLIMLIKLFYLRKKKGVNVEIGRAHV